MNSAHSQAGGKWLRTIDAIGVQVVEVPAGTVMDKIALYQRNPNVQFAEPNYHRLLILPSEGSGTLPPNVNIPFFAQQYGLNNTGQDLVDPDSFVYDFLTGELLDWGTYQGAQDADIDWTEATDVSQGSSAVKIAIIDSGVDCDHLDIQGKCVERLNFTGVKTLDPANDILGHGTHVAGISAAKTNNAIGIAGAGANSSLGALKACYEYDLLPEIGGYYIGLCEDVDTAAALTWAADNGYHVANMSFGGAENGATMRNAVQYAWDHDVVLVAAAGNDYSTAKFYPAAYPEVIAVGATDRYDNLAFFSNFSPSATPALPCSDASDPCWVDVLAPGHAILSTVSLQACGVADCYDWKTGTSMASPLVAGVAALVRAQYPLETNSQVKARIENSADQSGAFGQNMLAWSRHGRVNAHTSLTGSAPPPPASISLTAVGYKVKGLQKVDLTWSGSAAQNVDIWRAIWSSTPTFARITTTANNGAYTDNIDAKGTAAYIYKVCEVDTGICSGEVTVVF